MIITKEVALVALVILGGLMLSWVVIWLYDNILAKKGDKKDEITRYEER